MKKPIRTLLCLLLVSVLTAVPVLGDAFNTYNRIQSIYSVRVTIVTGELMAGDQLADDASSYVTVEDNMYYTLMSAEWLDNVQSLKVGDQPRMKIYLNAYPREEYYSTYTKIWLFTGNYSNSNVHVTGGEYISSGIRDSGYTLELTVRVKAIKGTYNAPRNAYWDSEIGRGKWEVAENDSGIYDVKLYRGEALIKELQSYTGNYYNFYPYMTKTGDYTFQVRCAVPENMKNKGATSSDWTYSSILTINDSQVSNGNGQTKDDEKNGSAGHSTGNSNYPNGTGNQNVAGWVTDSTGTYFRYPSGEYAKNGWLQVNGNWYLLDAAGKRLTGWQQNPAKNNWFYMDTTTGIMKTGWLQDGGLWYYLEPSGASQGARIYGWRDINGKRYYFNANGVMVTGWFDINGKWYYFYPQGSRADGGYGFLATNTQIGDFRIGADGTWQN